MILDFCLVAESRLQHINQKKKKSGFHPPDSLVLLSVDHCVLNGFVDQRVHVGCESVDGRRQSLAALRQKLLSLCIYAKRHLVFKLNGESNVCVTHRDMT